jgi:hypothetical protein
VPNYRDPFNMMGFLSDNLALMAYQHDELSKREPAAETFARFAALMDGATAVRRVETNLGIVAMEVDRPTGPLYVFWAEADPFTGEDEPPKLIEWPWPAETAHVCDVFGISRDAVPTSGHLSIGVTNTPLFVYG